MLISILWSLKIKHSRYRYKVFLFPAFNMSLFRTKYHCQGNGVENVLFLIEFHCFVFRITETELNSSEIVKWHNGGGMFHRTACIDSSVFIETGAIVHSNSVLGANVHIGSGTVVGPSVTIGNSTKVGYAFRFNWECSHLLILSILEYISCLTCNYMMHVEHHGG